MVNGTGRGKISVGHKKSPGIFPKGIFLSFYGCSEVIKHPVDFIADLPVQVVAAS